MKTKLLFGSDARSKLMTGVRVLADATVTTLGPTGGNVGIAKMDRYGTIFQRDILHDGYSVARSIDLEDEFENFGAMIVKEASLKQVASCGDGTTVTVLLARAILEEVNTLVSSGVNPMQLRSSLEKYLKVLTDKITTLSIPITTLEQKIQIATISAEDKELGELVARTVDQMGTDGLVVVEESKNTQTTVSKQDGMQLSSGFAHELFQTNPDRNEAILEYPHILVTDKDISALESIRTLIEHFASSGEKLVIITPNMSQDALSSLLKNKLKGVLSTLVIKAPGFGKNQTETLQDIAIFTGARYISAFAGHKLEEVTLEDLGRCEYITSTKTETLLVGGKGSKQTIQDRIKEIQTNITKETNDFDQEKMRERLAKLTTGIAVIYAGGTTEVEMKERLERIKDSVAATKAAITHGIVPGGEIVYLQAREALGSPQGEIDGLVSNLLFKVLYEPFKKLLNNAGLNDGMYYERIKTTAGNLGVDVTTGDTCLMVECGIIDPTLVPIEALKNAVSVAIALSTVNCLVIPIKSVEKPNEA